MKRARERAAMWMRTTCRAMIEAMSGKVLAAGLLIGTYSRGEEAPVGPVGTLAPA